MKKLDLDVVKLELAASKLRAMAHPMRIAIIDLLHNNKKQSVTEIYQKLDIEQAAASHHLNILKNK
ncbi:MAG: helix-turn-helix transcriptional regulator, partial [Bacteroidales bacterium]|nr:helix-turn-helix transcriptional regulator [Bacteroidales bacterium]